MIARFPEVETHIEVIPHHRHRESRRGVAIQLSGLRSGLPRRDSVPPRKDGACHPRTCLPAEAMAKGSYEYLLSIATKSTIHI